MTVGDVEVAYQVLGDGPIDLVYHHGFCHLDLQWDIRAEAAFNRRLSTFSRLILFDRRGTGASERLARESYPTVEEWVGDLRAVLEQVESTSTAIFAEAEGGAMAIKFAATYPDRVSALVLSNTSPRYAWAQDYRAGRTLADIDIAVSEVGDWWGIPSAFKAGFPSLAADPEQLEALARLTRGAATPGMAAATYRRIWEETDVRADLERVSVPTLVIATDYTPDVRHLLEHIPDVRLVTTANRGSLLFGDDFESAVSEVAAFLTGRHLDRDPVRKLVTVMMTDIASSTERLSAAGDLRWRAVLDGHDRAVRDELQRFGGREINTTGDGFIAGFDLPSSAIRCADRIVASLAELGVDVRVGLHAGECEVRGDDLAGIAVHIAARVAATANAGEVVVSKTLADLVLGSGLEFDDRGAHELKGVPGSWALVALRRSRVAG